MDINELQQTGVTALFSKLISQTNVTVDPAKSFATLLNKVESVDVDASAKIDNRNPKAYQDKTTDKPQIKRKEVEKVEAPKAESSNDKVAAKKEISGDSDAPQVQNSDDNDQKNVKAEAEANQSAIAEVEVNPLNNMVMATAIEIPTTEVNGFTAFENQTVADGIMADDAVFEGDNTAGAEVVKLPAGSLEIVGADGQPLQQVVSKPEQIVAFAEVSFVNPQTNQVETLSGVELSQQAFGLQATARALENLPQNVVANPAYKKVTDSSVQSVATQSAVELDTTAETVQPADFNLTAMVDDENTDVDVNPMLVTEKTTTQASNHNVSADLDAFNDADLAVLADETDLQASHIEKLTGKQQLNIEVTAEEEKFSYLNARDMVKDVLAVEQAVADSDKSAQDSLISPTALSQGNNKPNNITNNINHQAVAPLSAPTPQVAEESSSVASSTVAEVGNLSANTSHAGNLVSGEVAKMAHADTNTRSHDTTFKEVYKGMSKEVVEQVKVNITKSAITGVDTIDVRLKPEDLGHIEIKMQIKDGKLQAHIMSGLPETMDILQKNVQSLEQAFNDAGFQTDENSFSFSYQGQEQNPQFQDENVQLRNFIGEAFEKEADEAALSAEAANQNLVTENGVNIKV